MAKIKTKQLTIDWIEEKPGYLTGYVADYAPAISQIIEEFLNIPIDVPDLKSKLFTKEVTLVYPENFSEDRKQKVYETVKELYPDWKFDIPDDKNKLQMKLPEVATEQVA